MEIIHNPPPERIHINKFKTIIRYYWSGKTMLQIMVELKP